MWLEATGNLLAFFEMIPLTYMQIRLEKIISNSGDQLCNPGKAVTSYSSRKLQEAADKRCVYVCVREREEREMERQRDKDRDREICCWLEFCCLSLL